MEQLKVGDIVVMNDKYYEGKRNEGKLFAVRSEPQKIGGTTCVFLSGYIGAYAADGLTKATQRQRAIYILQNLEDWRFEKMLGKIQEIDDKLSALLEPSFENMSLKQIEEWREQTEQTRFLKLCDLNFFFDLLLGKHSYLYGEPVKGANV